MNFKPTALQVVILHLLRSRIMTAGGLQDECNCEHTPTQLRRELGELIVLAYVEAVALDDSGLIGFTLSLEGLKAASGSPLFGEVA